ncbi:hypothetical protein E2C01_083385 [Portunus trituberculatus]|uniref:Uncharacterized protein n=1 Tax=Portunus trituberculatus TaxID=210409 RepID=A0A5B7IV06_PORTR|nr:hypothetical protein [Portunus trituberculatus]
MGGMTSLPFRQIPQMMGR